MITIIIVQNINEQSTIALVTTILNLWINLDFGETAYLPLP